MIENKINGPETYEQWIDLGRIIIPCIKGLPIVKEWTSPDFKITKEEWKQKYSKCEIALRLDQDIDLDIDNELAKRFIKNYVKSCDSIFGRSSNPSSHYLWKGKLEYKKFSLPAELKDYCKNSNHGTTLCEIRTGEKRYTIVPRSLHSKNPEHVRWEKYFGINEYPPNLNSDLKKVALSTALCILYAPEGDRDTYCTAIAGTLLKHTDWPVTEINTFIHNIALASNDEDAEERKFKGSSAKKANRKFGMPKLAEILGCSVKAISDLFNWVGIKQIASEEAREAIGEIIEYGHDRYLVKINAIVNGKVKEKEIIVDGPTLKAQRFFYDEIIKQASVWVPEIKKDDYNSVMQGKYNNRTRSKYYEEEANEDLVFIKHFKYYIKDQQAFSNKINLLEYKRPHFDTTKNFLEFNLDSFEDYLTEKKIKIKRVDLVMKVQRILKAKKNHGKVGEKSCVSWRIKDYDIDKNDLVIDGEYEDAPETERITDES